MCWKNVMRLKFLKIDSKSWWHKWFFIFIPHKAIINRTVLFVFKSMARGRIHFLEMPLFLISGCWMIIKCTSFCSHLNVVACIWMFHLSLVGGRLNCQITKIYVEIYESRSPSEIWDALLLSPSLFLFLIKSLTKLNADRTILLNVWLLFSTELKINALILHNSIALITNRLW